MASSIVSFVLSRHQLLIPLCFWLFSLSLPAATLAGTTVVDDADGNGWSFPGGWNAVSASDPCHGCATKPDVSQMHSSSWHDGTGVAGLSGSFSFSGTGVNIYGADDRNPGNIVFTLDGGSGTTYNPPKTNDFQYNKLYYSASNLPNQAHTVQFSLQTKTDGSKGTVSLFDYAEVITPDNNAPSGGASGGGGSPSGSSGNGQGSGGGQGQSSPGNSNGNNNGGGTSANTSGNSNVSSNGGGGSNNSQGSNASSGSLPKASASSSNSASNAGAVIVNGTFTSTAQAVIVTSGNGVTSSYGQPTSSGSAATGSSSNKGAIIGGVIGGVVGALLVLLAFFLLRRQRQKRQEERLNSKAAHISFTSGESNRADLASRAEFGEMFSDTSSFASPVAPMAQLRANHLTVATGPFSQSGYTTPSSAHMYAPSSALTREGPRSAESEGSIRGHRNASQPSEDLDNVPEKSEQYTEVLRQRSAAQAEQRTTRELQLEDRVAQLEQRLHTLRVDNYDEPPLSPAPPPY